VSKSSGHKRFYGKGQQLFMQNDFTFNYKLYEMHYDLVGAFLNDAYTMIWYGGVDGMRKRQAHHNLIFGGVAAAGAHPTDRLGVYNTQNMAGSNGLVHLKPHYDHYEILNTSIVPMYVRVPYIVHWAKGYNPLGAIPAVSAAEDLMTVMANAVAKSNDQIQIAHDGATIVDMLWHGSAVTQDLHMQSFGSKAIGIDTVMYGDVYRLSRPKGWSWLLPPGKTCRFKVHVPGIPRCHESTFLRGASFRYMDYGMIIAVKGDFTFTAGGTTNLDINMSKHYVAIRRTSTSESVYDRLLCGREGYLLDNNRRTTAAAAPAAQVAPAVKMEYNVNNTF